MSTTTPARQDQPPRRTRAAGRPGDRIFRATATLAGSLILVTLAGVAVFLLYQALPALTASPEDGGGTALVGYVWPLLFGTLLSSAIALLIGAPLGVGIALFISHYAPRRLSAGLGYLVDLLAAVPSIVFGLWGVTTLAPALVPIYGWLERNLGFVPLFSGPASASGRTMLTAGLVLAVMILPVITAITREIFTQTPRLHQEAAMALGATRWEMVRYAVLPYARSGIVSASMLGLGRALGETMAVALVLSISGGVTFNLIGTGNPGSIAANIALQFPEAAGLDRNVLVTTGLVLFVVTFLVNFAARAIVNRRAEFSGAN